MLLDSNGFTTVDDAEKRLQEWEQQQEHLVPGQTCIHSCPLFKFQH